MKKRKNIPGFGARCLIVRLIFKKSQLEMGFAVGKEGWGGYESENTVPSAAAIAELCRLRINANWLLTGEESILRADVPIDDPLHLEVGRIQYLIELNNPHIAKSTTHPFRKELDDLKEDFTCIKNQLNQILALSDRRPMLPDKRLSPNPMGRKCHMSHKLRGGFSDPEVRTLVMDLRKKGQTFIDIEIAVRDAYPNNPEKHVKRSAIHRFYESARKGRLIAGFKEQFNPISFL